MDRTPLRTGILVGAGAERTSSERTRVEIVLANGEPSCRRENRQASTAVRVTASLSAMRISVAVQAGALVMPCVALKWAIAGPPP
jgi:hypothetical protein